MELGMANGGQVGMRGYLAQTLIAILDSLDPATPWNAITIEPDLKSDKVDVLWEMNICNEPGQGDAKCSIRKKAVQVKSSQNPFETSDVTRWARELADGKEADENELILVGHAPASVLKIHEVNSVRLVHRALDLQAFRERIAHRLDRVLLNAELPRRDADYRELLADALTGKLATLASRGVRTSRDEFMTLLDSWTRQAHGEVVRHSRPLESCPAVCCGRDEQIGAVVTALTAERPLPVGVLGHPGIGKSTIARSALYADAVEKRFGNRRFFVRCDAVKGASSLAAELASHLGLPISTEPDVEVFRELRGGPAAIVLDNFETPWRSEETTAVEELLTKLTQIPGVGICVTLRGPVLPKGPAWANSVNVAPLSLPHAKAAFVLHARGFESDPELEALLGSMEGVPLAIFLLASAADGEPNLQRLKRRWDQKRTKLLRRAEMRVSSADEANWPFDLREVDIEASYEVSLEMGDIDGNDAAQQVMAMLALLPGGVADETLRGLGPPETDEAVVHLNRLGLIFYEKDRVRMLAPLREYAEDRFPSQHAVQEKAIRHFLELIARHGGDIGTARGGDVLRILTPEAGNIEAILLRVLRGAWDAKS